jgi:hypothetical protein
MKIETVDEAVEITGVKCCVYGLAGAGKTVLTSTIDGTIIILSAESGLLSLKNAPSEVKERMRIIQIKTLTDLGEAYAWLASKKMADWVGIDSGSEIAEVLLSVKKGENKDPRAAYGDMADEMMQLFRSIRDLPNYNVVMTAKMTRLKDDFTGITNYVPMFPGRILTNQIPYMFDEVFALRVEQDPTDPTKLVRVLQTGRDISYDCKDRSGMLDMFEPASLGHITRKIQGIPVAIPAAAPANEEKEEG